VALETALKGLSMAGLQEIEYGLMYDVNQLGEDDADNILMDDICRAFEAASEAILNRNCKSSYFGLGSWAGTQDCTLSWLRTAPSVKAFRVIFTNTHRGAVATSWDHVITSIEKVLNMCQDRCLPTLQPEGPGFGGGCPLQGLVFGPISATSQVTGGPPAEGAGDFLRKGHLDRLA
jgi:hypothetical protein